MSSLHASQTSPTPVTATPTSKSGSALASGSEIILSVHIPILGRSKKIRFNSNESVQDALQVNQGLGEIRG